MNVNLKIYVLSVELSHLLAYDDNLASQLQNRPEDYIPFVLLLSLLFSLKWQQKSLLTIYARFQKTQSAIL